MTRIRPARKEDLKQCEKVLRTPNLALASGEYLGASVFANYLDENYFLVAEDNNEIVGCIIGEPMKARLVLLWFLAVKENFRGKGVGKRLLLEFEKRCRKQKVKWVVLYAPAKDNRAVNFYQKQKYALGKRCFEMEKKL